MTEPRNAPWGPSWTPVDTTRQMPVPDARPPQTPSPWPSGPPVADRGALPPAPPLPPGAAPSTPGVGPSGLPGVPAPAAPGGPGRRMAFVALALVLAVFAAGVGGVLVGRSMAGDGDTASVDATPVQTQPVTTAPGPVSAGTSEPVAAVAAALSPAVVQIETQTGLGSGFIYDKSGLILTAAHVTDGADTVRVRTADGRRVNGTVLGSDDSTDVAVIRIPASKDLPVAVLATGVPLRVGQTAIAIGSPFGLDQTVTAGIVSAVGRATQTPGGYIPAVQTDAPINSGNSGGALADVQGRIIGINDSIITGSSGASGNVGVGFAIPIDLAKTVADLIVAGKPTAGGFLGIKGQSAIGPRAGATITSIEPGSPARTGGLEEGDIVTAVNGRQVETMIDLAAAIRTQRPGDTITLSVLRDGKALSVKVKLTTPPN